MLVFAVSLDRRDQISQGFDAYARPTIESTGGDGSQSRVFTRLDSLSRDAQTCGRWRAALATDRSEQASLGRSTRRWGKERAMRGSLLGYESQSLVNSGHF